MEKMYEIVVVNLLITMIIGLYVITTIDIYIIVTRNNDITSRGVSRNID